MVGRKSFLYLFSQFFISFLSFVALIIVVRKMGPEPIGVIGYCAGIIGLFSSFSSLGFTTTHKKRVSEGMDLGLCIGTYSTIKILLVAIWVFALIVWVGYSKFISKKFLLEPEEELVLYIVALYTVIYQISDIFKSTFIARTEIVKLTYVEVFSKLITVFSKITVAIVGMGVIFLAASQLLGYIVLLGLFFLLFRGYPFRLPTMASIKSYTYFTMPLFLTILMIQFTVSLDKTIIGYYWGFEAVGFYTVPQSIVYLMYMVASALTAILLPSLSKKYAEGDIDYVNRTVILAEKYIFLILTPVIVMVMIYAEVIIVSLFSEIFLPAVDIFRILAFVIYLRAINSPYSTKLVSTGYVKLVFVGSLFFYIPHLILDFVFVPEIFLGIKMLGLGGKGAALASLTGVFLGSIAVRYFNYKTTGIGLNYRVILYFFSGASMASVLVILNIVFNINNLFVAILSSTLGLIYYFLILHVLKEFGRNEINFFIDIINPTKMKDYIKEEIS